MNASTLKRLDKLEAEIARREKALTRAEGVKNRFVLEHCKRNPLTAEVVAEMAAHVRGGGELCCDKGFAWLQEHVDPIWARVLNCWAHDALSCSEDRPERLQEYAQKITDRLLAGTFPSAALVTGIRWPRLKKAARP